MKTELPKRKKLRLSDFYYGTPGSYFITICTADHHPILSRILYSKTDDSASVILSKKGEIANDLLNQMRDFYPTISILHYVIMPNHIHLILAVTEEESKKAMPEQHAAVSRFIATFKRFCNKTCGQNMWQRGFHDHIIRNRADYDKHVLYIDENPIRWHTDELFFPSTEI